MPLPKIPIGNYVENVIEWLDINFSFITKAIADFIEWVIESFVDILGYIPPWLLIVIISLSVWRITRKKGSAVFTLVGLTLIWNLKLWPPTLTTVALVLFATTAAIIIGIPLGILAALSKRSNGIIMPVLDFMQTMPAFVYLIPAIPFFGIGKVSAVVATVIFAMPPAIRLTSLGIKQVPVELIEAGDSFGSTGMQKLVKIQLPIAAPTIMAGINQVIMLSLSMAVIAAMIGAKGLGGEVWKGIQRNNLGMGFEAGLGVVIIAMVLDRLTHRVKKGK
jgi:glycine betaine/proline transport system permease protein